MKEQMDGLGQEVRSLKPIMFGMKAEVEQEVMQQQQQLAVGFQQEVLAALQELDQAKGELGGSISALAASARAEDARLDAQHHALGAMVAGLAAEASKPKPQVPAASEDPVVQGLLAQVQALNNQFAGQEARVQKLEEYSMSLHKDLVKTQ